jgi:hypothetical protein
MRTSHINWRIDSDAKQKDAWKNQKELSIKSPNSLCGFHLTANEGTNFSVSSKSKEIYCYGID